ncbi:MAG: hypothetical protein OXH94_09450, partial [Rhodospirillales bacterium]|nr:hypothetical protein [Rhodospirillales bacterium]
MAGFAATALGFVCMAGGAGAVDFRTDATGLAGAAAATLSFVFMAGGAGGGIGFFTTAALTGFGRSI